MCIVGRAIRLGTLSRLDRLSCLDSSGLIIPSVRGYRRHHDPVARTVGERVQGRFDQVQFVGELDELVPLAVQPVIGASQGSVGLNEVRALRYRAGIATG